MTMKSWLAAVAAVGVAVVAAASTVSPAASASVQLPQRAGVTKVTTAEWAGYAALAAKGRHFRYVTADFTIPTVGCSSGVTVSQWVGLDGYGHGHGTAEQIGVSELCDFTGEHPTFDAWYSGASGSDTFLFCVDIGGCPQGPHLGDEIQLSVYFNGKTYRLSYHDVTLKVHRKFYLRCAKCHNKSAEVINQVSSGGGALSGFTVNFFGVRVTSADGRRGTVAPKRRYWTTAAIFMVDPASTNVASPSALLRQGRAFYVGGGSN